MISTPCRCLAFARPAGVGGDGGLTGQIFLFIDFLACGWEIEEENHAARN